MEICESHTRVSQQDDFIYVPMKIDAELSPGKLFCNLDDNYDISVRIK